jgi:hypothetical protein
MVLSARPDDAMRQSLARDIVTGMKEEDFNAMTEDAITRAINHAIAGLPADHAFTDAAAKALASLPSSSTTSGIPVSNQYR